MASLKIFKNPPFSFLILFALLVFSIEVVSVESNDNSEKLPVFALVDIFHIPPESRQKCSTILGWLATKYPNNYVLMSVRNIIYQLALPHSQLQENAEKELIAAMDSLQGTMSNVSGLEPGTYISILTCSVDNKGRTILQKMVEHGLVQALSHTLSQKFWVGAKLNRLLDTEGNNLAHLAAMSENDELVHFVLGIMFKSNVVADMLESVNSNGQKPIDIAIHHRDQQTVDTMKNFFRVTTLAEREGFVDGVEVIEDSVTLAEKEAENKKFKEFIEREENAASKITDSEITKDIEYAKQDRYKDRGNDDIQEIQSQSFESSIAEDSSNPSQLTQSLEDDYSIKPRFQDQEISKSDNIQQEQTFSDENVIYDEEGDENTRGNQRLSSINKIESLENKAQPEEVELNFPSLRGTGENGDHESQHHHDSHEDFKKINKEPTSRWNATAKAIVGASILVGTSILAATVVFIVCKGYGNKEENSF
ncbi:uncharacterized protein cubi_00092 [Cryptosporidium ubiquitum]|uniref:Ankyrin repeat-containing protein n=1 Tax=Cryptosporidium ubiquitum TaxID=857276 RepID=A0A1J4MM55_9CRYT|nr:uncharacterized protein cubi_00092 [Cryptosporidium ubiquitum]OII74539.1 hypothetical protein cubi_00092 [Cryptosporidium ubiquitum]